MAKVAILGATGAVGRTMLQVLEERSLPIDELVLLASERSAGSTVLFKGKELTVQAVSAESFEGVAVAIFSAGATRSREWAPIAVAAGATVVDNSSAFRMQPDVPLVVADVNPHAIHSHSGIIANPNCSTMQLMPILRPVRDAVGLERITVATYQAVSGTGQSAIDALREEAADVLAGNDDPEARQYPKPIAFDVLPVAGSFSGDQGYTDEELKLVHESRKILELPDLRVHVSRRREVGRRVLPPLLWGEIEALEAILAREGRAVLRCIGRQLKRARVHALDETLWRHKRHMGPGDPACKEEGHLGGGEERTEHANGALEGHVMVHVLRHVAIPRPAHHALR